jgi:hypothetical protein
MEATPQREDAVPVLKSVTLPDVLTSALRELFKRVAQLSDFAALHVGQFDPDDLTTAANTVNELAEQLTNIQAGLPLARDQNGRRVEISPASGGHLDPPNLPHQQRRGKSFSFVGYLKGAPFFRVCDKGRCELLTHAEAQALGIPAGQIEIRAVQRTGKCYCSACNAGHCKEGCKCDHCRADDPDEIIRLTMIKARNIAQAALKAWQS